MTVSKELFEAVMGSKYKISTVNMLEDGIGYGIAGGGLFIRYNDFFFKCKEWAYEQEYFIESSITRFNPDLRKGYSAKALPFNVPDNIFSCGKSLDDIFYESDINVISEQQAVFDAAQWILENK